MIRAGKISPLAEKCRLVSGLITKEEKACRMHINDNEVGKIYVELLELERFDREFLLKVGKFKMMLERL